MPWDALRDLLVLNERAAARPGECCWIPLADLYETPSEYVVVLELPGIRRDDLRISVSSARALEVAGRRPPAGVPPEAYHRIERGHGPFARTISFPQPIDADRVSADLSDGVLTITVQKTAPPGPRRVEIR
jgi:HSP20 family protein